MTFHYATREAIRVPITGPLDLSNPNISNHVQDWANYYWDLSQPGGTGMIRGLYLASDPVASRDFGKEHWMLYQVTLHEGLTFLDMARLVNGNNLIPDEALGLIQSYGCDLRKWNYLIYKSFDQPCREIALQTLRDLDIDFIDYSWVSADYSFCTSRPDDSFILLKPSRLLNNAVQIFYSEMDVTENENAAIIESFFMHVKPNANESSGTTYPITSPENYKLWPELDSVGPDQDAFDNILRESIFGCQS